MLPDHSGVPSPMIPAGGFAPGFDAQLHSMLPSLQQLESRLLPCPHPGCKRQFKNTSTLTGHLKTHAGKGSRFTCTFPPCAEKFSRRHDQLRHEVYKHGKQCEWVCSRCGSFFLVRAVAREARLHDGQEQTWHRAVPGCAQARAVQRTLIHALSLLDFDFVLRLGLVHSRHDMRT